MDDELLKEFINESREHLANIEADLLTIEENGADIDEELVNKVFRAAHSIKGGQRILWHPQGQGAGPQSGKPCWT